MDVNQFSVPGSMGMPPQNVSYSSKSPQSKAIQRIFNWKNVHSSLFLKIPSRYIFMARILIIATSAVYKFSR